MHNGTVKETGAYFAGLFASSRERVALQIKYDHTKCNVRLMARIKAVTSGVGRRVLPFVLCWMHVIAIQCYANARFAILLSACLARGTIAERVA